MSPIFGGKMVKAQKQRLKIYKLTNGSQTITIKSKVGSTLMASSLYKVWRRMFTSFFSDEIWTLQKNPALYRDGLCSSQSQNDSKCVLNRRSNSVILSDILFTAVLSDIYIYILFCLTFMSQQKHCLKVQAQWYTKNILKYTLIFGYQIWTS
jgi:hypothetical protein